MNSLGFCSLLQIKLPIPSMPSSDALLRTDSLSGTDPVLSDGSVGSAPSLGLSPGPTSGMEMNRNQEKVKQKGQEVSGRDGGCVELVRMCNSFTYN